MASFSFDEINKIITVEAPATEVTIQELINAIRDWEDELDNMDLPKVADASGKESLGGGLVVGITLNLLNNWQLKFEDRPGPDFIQCIVKDGNLVGGVAGDPIKESAYTQVMLILSAAGTIAETGVSGLTAEESEKLLAIPSDTLTSEEHSQVMQVAGVKAKTDNLPPDPADQSLVEAHVTTKVQELKEPTIDGYDRDKDSLKKLSDKLDEILAAPPTGGGVFSV